MGLVHHEEVQPGILEHFNILLARQQQFQLLRVRQQNARSLSRCPHLFAGNSLFRRMDSATLSLNSQFFDLGLVVFAGRARGQPRSGNIRCLLWSLAHIQSKGHAHAA